MGRSKKRRWRELQEMKHFGRVLRLVWPHRRYLAVAMVAMIGGAICYTGSIATLYPIVKVLIRNETVHEVVDKLYVQSRLGPTLVVQETSGIAGLTKYGTHAVRVVTISEDDPLFEGGVRRYEFIVGLNGEYMNGYKLMEKLSQLDSGTSVTLMVWSAERGDQAVSVTTRVGHGKWYWGQLRALVYRLVPRGPTELTAAERATRRVKMLSYVLLVSLLFVIVGNACRFVGEYFGAIVGARTLIDLRRQMYAKALMLPMGVYLTRGTSDTMARFVRDTQDVLRALRTLFGKVLREPLKMVMVFAFAVALEPRLTLMLIVMSAIAAVLFRKFGKIIRRANEKLLAAYGQLVGALESTLTGLRVVKAYTMEHRERKRYFAVERGILRHSLRIERVTALSSPLLEVLGVLAASGSILLLLYVAGMTDTDKVVALMGAMVALFDPVRKMSNVYSQVQRANAASKRIFELIDTPTEFELSEGRLAAAEPRRGLTFEKVQYTYPGSGHPALSQIDLDVPAGKVVALVGPNGSGKTTLVSLVLRLFDPQGGAIRWDGTDLRSFRLRSLRKHISYVSQETVIFADSIRNNIAYGKNGATLDEIVSAAKQAHADEFIERLPEGYDTVVGEHGATLSGGERQRLAIARAILRDAPVLIFDEATSQIDSESEAKIQDAIDHFMPGRTALVIAHRFSTIAKADKIVVMDQGRIVSSGEHETLMNRSELYRSLYQTQLHGLGRG